jgi:hypothetical protein
MVLKRRGHRACLRQLERAAGGWRRETLRPPSSACFSPTSNHHPSVTLHNPSSHHHILDATSPHTTHYTHQLGLAHTRRVCCVLSYTLIRLFHTLIRLSYTLIRLSLRPSSTMPPEHTHTHSLTHTHTLSLSHTHTHTTHTHTHTHTHKHTHIHTASL